MSFTANSILDLSATESKLRLSTTTLNESLLESLHESINKEPTRDESGQELAEPELTVRTERNRRDRSRIASILHRHRIGTTRSHGSSHLGHARELIDAVKTFPISEARPPMFGLARRCYSRIYPLENFRG